MVADTESEVLRVLVHATERLPMATIRSSMPPRPPDGVLFAESSIRVALRKLEGKGHVNAEHRGRRRYWAVTEEGRTLAKLWGLV